MQFVVKDINDQQTRLLENALLMVHSLLSTWRSAAEKGGKEVGKHHDPTKTHEQVRVVPNYTT